MANESTPFFVVGCPGSGVSLVKRLLDLHPHLLSPAPTHFYRWGEPLGTSVYARNYQAHPLLQKYREVDGLSNSEFQDVLGGSLTRRNLFTRYTRALEKEKGLTDVRWFDATPQHIYGLLLLHAQFPQSPIVHVVRHPLDVVARLTRVGAEPFSLDHAINAWLESTQIANVFSKIRRATLIELRYETLLASPQRELHSLLTELGEDAATFPFERVLMSHRLRRKARLGDVLLRPPREGAGEGLSPEDVAYVLKRCGKQMERLGYSTESQQAGTARLSAPNRATPEPVKQNRSTATDQS